MFVVHYHLKHHHGHRRAKVQNLVRWTRAEYNKVLGACDLLLTPTVADFTVLGWSDGASLGHDGPLTRPAGVSGCPSCAEGGWRGSGKRPAGGTQAGAARGQALAVILRKSRTRRGFLAKRRMVSATASPRALMRPMAKRRSRVMFSLSVRADDRGVGRPGMRVTGTRLRRNLATVGNCAWRYGRRMTEPVHEVGVNPRSPEPPAAPPRGVDQPTGRGHFARTGSECANGGVPKTLTGFVRRSNVAAGANCVWSRTRSGLPICAASLTVSSFCGPKERELRGGGPSRTGARWFHRFASTVVPDTMSVIGVGTRENRHPSELDGGINSEPQLVGYLLRFADSFGYQTRRVTQQINPSAEEP